MRALFSSTGIFLPLILPLLQFRGATAVSPAPGPGKNFYYPGDLIDVSCLNRTIDTGEHVSDTHGHLQYIQFPPPPLTCLENAPTGLQLPFLSEAPFNCTIATITDELYHLLEFYVHADSPLSCRIPRRPLGGERDLSNPSLSESEEWIPLVISLSGKIELSHVHISNHINLIIHISPDEVGASSSSSASNTPGMIIDSASAYSISPLSSLSQTKIIPGDALPLIISPRWYPTPGLPRGTIGSLKDPKSGPVAWAPGTGVYDGGHVTVHTILYCLLSCLATAVVCTGYFRGWEFPRRLKRYGYERRGGGGEPNGGMGGRVGYGYGVGPGGYGGGGGFGKKD